MASGWIYQVDGEGLLVSLEFMKRLKDGDKSALRALEKQNLTLLYRRNFSRLHRRADESGLFWSDVPPAALIRMAHGGRHRIPAWLPDGEAFRDEPATARRLRGLGALARTYRSRLGDQTVYVKITAGGKKVVATKMKANPKFELVVVNRYDRGALLKLLSELDSAANVEDWLSHRTEKKGATLSKVLHLDYQAWCERHGNPAAGSKAFAQALVAAGVVKLARSAGGERYELELLPA